MSARDAGCRHAIVALRGSRGDAVVARVMRKVDGSEGRSMWVRRSGRLMHNSLAPLDVKIFGHGCMMLLESCLCWCFHVKRGDVE